MYIFYPDSRISVEHETRLTCSAKELEKWRKEQCKYINIVL